MFTPEPWHPARPGLFRPGRLDPAGLTGPTRSQSQRSYVRRTSHGFYLPSWVEQTTPQRIVEVSMVMSGGQAITGWAVLHWLGARWFDGLDGAGAQRPVQILISTHDLAPRPGIEVSGEGNPGGLREVVDGLVIVDPRSAVSFLMRYSRTVWDAVRVLDMAAYDDLVSIAEMSEFLAGQSSWTGIPKARDAVPLASESSWSPAEVDMRGVWVGLAGRTPPLCNQPVFDLSGRHVATPDLLDPVAGVAGEYEGPVHLDRPVRDADVRREGLLRGVGLEMVTMVAGDRRDPGHFIGRLHDAYRRAAHVPVSDRVWTIEPPPWWVPTLTVAQRRALDPEQRRRFLGYRAS